MTDWLKIRPSFVNQSTLFPLSHAAIQRFDTCSFREIGKGLENPFLKLDVTYF
jgi:hypothetical protein